MLNTYCPARIFKLPQGMLMQNYDPRGEHIGPLIGRLQETGITEHFNGLYMPYKGMKKGIQVEDEVLDLQPFYLPLAFLAVGISAGWLAFVAEIQCMIF